MNRYKSEGRPFHVSHPSHDFTADVCSRCGVRLDGRVASRSECAPPEQPDDSAAREALRSRDSAPVSMADPMRGDDRIEGETGRHPRSKGRRTL